MTEIDSLKKESQAKTSQIDQMQKELEEKSKEIRSCQDEKQSMMKQVRNIQAQFDGAAHQNEENENIIQSLRESMLVPPVSAALCSSFHLSVFPFFLPFDDPQSIIVLSL